MPASGRYRSRFCTRRLLSGHEWIPGRLAKNPEEDQEREPGPQINWRNEETPLWLARHGAARESQKAVDDKRQRQHHKRVQLERADWMQVK